MPKSVAPKNGLNALLTPEESVLVLIDHQPFQFANLHSHEPTMIANNVVALAKAAKVFGVPTILTTVLEDRGGKLIKGLQDVFPDQKPIDRTFINTWEDARVVEAVKKTGRKKVISACTAAIDARQATDADLAEMYRRRGVALWRFRDYQAGLNDIDRALAMKPDWPLALTDRGRALMRLNRIDEAAESFVNALKIDPDFLPGHTGLGWVYSNYNDKEGQLREYSRAVEIDPSDPKALVGRA